MIRRSWLKIPERRMLWFVESYQGKHGRPPTLTECAEYLQITRQGAHWRARVLEKLGRMRNLGGPRGWTVVPQVAAPPEPSEPSGAPQEAAE